MSCMGLGLVGNSIGLVSNGLPMLVLVIAIDGLPMLILVIASDMCICSGRDGVSCLQVLE